MKFISSPGALLGEEGHSEEFSEAYKSCLGQNHHTAACLACAVLWHGAVSVAEKLLSWTIPVNGHTLKKKKTEETI